MEKNLGVEYLGDGIIGLAKRLNHKRCLKGGFLAIWLSHRFISILPSVI
jgi:hypothetical protein